MVRFISGHPCNTSTIDCFLSALILRARMASGVEYFNRKSQELLKPIIYTCILFGIKGCITRDDLLCIVSGDEMATKLINKYLGDENKWEIIKFRTKSFLVASIDALEYLLSRHACLDEIIYMKLSIITNKYMKFDN